jgi:hypothetical protein
MEDVTRKRVMRRLEALPAEQLYQVLDFIEFLEAKYAREASRKPDPFQRFAERVEDQMRVRSLAPMAMKGTMRIMSTAGKVLDGVRELGRDIVQGPPAQSGPTPASGAGSSGGRGGPVDSVPEADEALGNGGSTGGREE